MLDAHSLSAVAELLVIVFFVRNDDIIHNIAISARQLSLWFRCKLLCISGCVFYTSSFARRSDVIACMMSSNCFTYEPCDCVDDWSEKITLTAHDVSFLYTSLLITSDVLCFFKNMVCIFNTIIIMYVSAVHVHVVLRISLIQFASA